MLPFARVEVGSPAERRCRLCRPSSTPVTWRSVADVAAELKEVVSEWTAPVGPSVLLAGAEPFAHPSLPAIVAAARDAGFERIGIETDATALVRGENARGSLHAGVRHLSAMLFGVGEMGDAMAGAPGASATALQGIERFVQVAADEHLVVAVSVVVPVCRHNVEHLPVIVAAAARAGAARVVLEAAEAVAESAGPIVAAACDTGTVNRAWVEVRGVPLPTTHEVHRGGEVLRA
ncbi:hypothetical protein MX659_04665 [Coriobacteriia bacterium Es71-Z0120]|uniref:hypothetical protein n=1 Tax=Parvivirga hydrogeniphila TaxID=2939460 RepID=UPI002260E0CC|nr:hypothetical protein [Parvivirga hydrogeniphila]MCL4078887.1 hypothetical protein [Parvivirga hydrogeniphila]